MSRNKSPIKDAALKEKVDESKLPWYSPNYHKLCAFESCGRKRKARSGRFCYRHTRSHKSSIYNRTDKVLFLKKVYAQMQVRVRGQDRKLWYFRNSPICTREEFVRWAKKDASFKKTFKAWQESGFLSAFTPTCFKLASSHGYIPRNLDWGTKRDAAKWMIHLEGSNTQFKSF